MNETLRIQQSHRSIRSYKPDPVSDAMLDQIIAAAHRAPTSMNAQEISLIVVRDAERRARIAELAGGQAWIAQEGKENFQHAGGGEYHYIPCLNDRNDWMHALTDLVLDNLHGWLTVPDAAELEQSRLRALGMGAAK